MCVAAPGKVIALHSDGADVLVSGRTRRVSTLLLPDLRVGEYVLIASGMATDRLSEEEALARIGLFDQLLEVFDENV
jgi:hydrogenase expression/formation protein HypC